YTTLVRSSRRPNSDQDRTPAAGSRSGGPDRGTRGRRSHRTRQPPRTGDRRRPLRRPGTCGPRVNSSGSGGDERVEGGTEHPETDGRRGGERGDGGRGVRQQAAEEPARIPSTGGV